MRYPTIALWGDSLGRGIDFDQVRGRYAVLRQGFYRLLEESGLLKIDNHARFGATVVEGLADFEATGDIEAEYVALEYGGNDCNIPWAQIAEDPHGQYDAATPLAVFEKTLTAFAEAVRARNLKPLLVTPPPLIAERFVDWVSQGLNKANILAHLGDVQHVYRWQERYSVAVRRVADSLRCKLFDARDLLLAADDYPALVGVDGMHLNEQGHAYLARAVEQRLPFLEED